MYMKISPSAFKVAKKNSVKMMFRQSDFGLVFACNIFTETVSL